MGEEAFVSGVGSVSVLLPGTNDIYVVAPIYWFPNNNASTLPPGTTKYFSGFKSTLVKPLEYCDFIDYPRKKFSCDTTIKNILDNLKLKLTKPTQVLGYKPKRANRCTY